MAQTKKKASTKGKSRKKQKNKVNPTGLAAGFIIGGVLLAVFLFLDAEAPVNGFFKKILLGLFGKPAVLLPFILIGLGIYCFNRQDRVAEKTVLSFLSLICVSALFHLCTGGMIISVADSYQVASGQYLSESIGGGVFGAVISCPLCYMIHRVASFIIIFIAFLIFISLLIRYSIFAAIFGGAKGIYGAVKESAKEIDTKKDFEQAYIHSKEAAKKITSGRSMSGEEILDAAKGFSEDKHKNKNVKPEPVKSRRRTDTPAAEAKEEKFETGIEQVFSDIFSGSEPADDKTPETTTDREERREPAPEPAEELIRHMEMEPEKKKKEKRLTEEEQTAFAQEINDGLDAEAPEYVYPTAELLNKPKNSGGDSRQQMYETSNRLISILDNFGVKAKLLQVTQGPAVTRYEILPSSGVKLSKIVGLADDLALNLAVTTVLVAPVPGKAAVGIEVPNKETAAVSAREMLESDEFVKSKSKLSIALGRDIGGRVVVGDIAKMPHLLIAGSTGSGKSVCINTIITSLLFKASPEEVKLIMVDPKVVELGVYNGIPHLLIPVVTDPKKAAGALNWAVSEMMRRYDIFAENAVKNLEGYNQLMDKTGGARLPQIVIIIDELADLMMVAAKEVEDYICRLAQLARAAGLHLIVATQRPTVDVITGLIKANIPSRIAFAVASQVDSRTIIDRGGADKLLGRGDMLYAPQGCRSPLRVQGAYVSDDEIERLLDFLKSQNEDAHYSEDLEEHIERVSTGENGVTPDSDDDGDELLPQAIELAVELGQISTAMIQRRLKVGYSRAGRIIDQMEERGVIGPANGSKPRQVYISHADLNV